MVGLKIKYICADGMQNDETSSNQERKVGNDAVAELQS